VEYLGRDHNWILDNLDIWQLESFNKRIQSMKLKEQKKQALMFAATQAGMNGVKFSGIRTASEYWNNPIIEEMMADKTRLDKEGYAKEEDVNTLLKMLGG